eukprot:gb/GFBE01033754.1/.p1 GENE.gb/GFBE01033754.1/~~gb/GFBE01033754.1/.p1  ORF type:complete len:145 (+),score=23.03 gb/GFBE01033754.1/:1-435(+)
MAQSPGQNMLEIKGDVAHRLEANGALDQIRAQIRASVYRALLGAQEDAGAVTAQADDAPEAPLPIVSVVSDFLESLDLGMTKEVFLRETTQRPLGREELEKELVNATLKSPGSTEAVLEQVLAAAQSRGERSGVPDTIDEENCR